jgi:hypothetical protein
MRRDFHVQRGANDNWVVINQAGAPMIGFRRRSVAEAYGKALAHRAKVSLIVHRNGEGSIRYSERDLTYSVRL